MIKNLTKQISNLLLSGLLAAMCFLAACAVTESVETTESYTRKIASLEEILNNNPGDGDALQELGIIYFQMKQYPQARDYLKKAKLADDRNAKTLFYYGMTQEADSNLAGAFATYLRYSEVSRPPRYPQLMEGRYRALTKIIIRHQIDSLVVREKQLGEPTSSGTVAVFPLEYQGKDEKFSSLGKGLGELLINDLGQVSSLKLVERIRVEALYDELRFAATGKMDMGTAPRLGKFLSAGRVVGGRYEISTNNIMRVDVSSFDIVRKDYPEPSSQTDDLENLFRIEKDLVFGIVRDMGITLTKTEKERIQRIPTKNIQAFMMYTKGLESEDFGDYKAASVYYGQAAALDPNYSEARAKADAMGSLSLAGGSMPEVMAAAHAIDPPIPADSRNGQADLIISRLQNLGGNVSGNFKLGIESRKPPEEAARSGAAVGDLPLPPKPPGN